MAKLKEIEHDTNEKGRVIFNGPDCTNCKYFKTDTMSYPSGKCSLHRWTCGINYYCDDFENK